MSALDPLSLPDIPGVQADAVFLEPWHAEIFSLAVALSRKGAFTWSEWVEVFSSALREIHAEEGESAETTYYRRWLAALERIVAHRGLASCEEMAKRKEEWRRAYLRTPHGQPIALERGLEIVRRQHEALPLAHSHTPHLPGMRPGPIAVSAARVERRSSKNSTQAI
jgi:nitrile hydratase accessory protein